MEYQESKMNELHVIAIFGDDFATRFMQDADMFESFKIIAKPVELALTLKPGCTKTKALSDLRNLLEQSKQRVAAVFIPNDPEGAWRNEKILSISDGTKWCMLKACLDAYGFVQAEPVDAIPA
jgi:hypothetical protein